MLDFNVLIQVLRQLHVTLESIHSPRQHPVQHAQLGMHVPVQVHHRPCVLLENILLVVKKLVLFVQLVLRALQQDLYHLVEQVIMQHPALGHVQYVQLDNIVQVRLAVLWIVTLGSILTWAQQCAQIVRLDGNVQTKTEQIEPHVQPVITQQERQRLAHSVQLDQRVRIPTMLPLSLVLQELMHWQEVQLARSVHQVMSAHQQQVIQRQSVMKGNTVKEVVMSVSFVRQAMSARLSMMIK